MKSVEQFGVVGHTTISSCFYGCINMTDFVAGNTDVTTALGAVNLFNNCRALVNCDLTGFNTDNLISTSGMFRDCQTLTTVDITSITPSAGNVTTSAMFRNCYLLTEATGADLLDTTDVTNMTYMFYNTGLDVDVSSYNISSLTNAAGMMQNSSFSNANYDLMLVGWAGQDPNILDDVSFHAGTAKYTKTAERGILTDPPTAGHNWTITDGGPA